MIGALVAQRARRRECLVEVLPQGRVPQRGHVPLLPVARGQMRECIDGRHEELALASTELATIPLDAVVQLHLIGDALQVEHELCALPPHDNELVGDGALEAPTLHLSGRPGYRQRWHRTEGHAGLRPSVFSFWRIAFGRHLAEELGQGLQQRFPVLDDELPVVEFGERRLQPLLVFVEEGHAVPLHALGIVGRRLWPALVR
mmetsp:Transcript_123385/g.263089  ORF Transcript_123385/g.263089 Transcript_123385/m.263089 type:complete len:202 (+) Transcript_123385:833-1438(+)